MAAQEEKARAEQVRQGLTKFYGGMHGGKSWDWERHRDKGLMPECTAEVFYSILFIPIQEDARGVVT